jgi:pseudouridine-5'-phosphate glycosidase
VQLAAEVAAALAAGRPVVALESTLIAHGLPRPDNLRVAAEVEAAVREEGAVPATIALLDGQVRVGLDRAALERIADGERVTKVSLQTLPLCLARGVAGATTVASTAYLAARAGIRVFATGGLGGVHRGAAETRDVSADLPALARSPIVVVCAGVKSILDVPATLEVLETLGVTVVGMGTDRFPGFYLADAGLPVEPVASVAEVAAVWHAQRSLGLSSALVVANPPPADTVLGREEHDRVLASALAEAAAAGVQGRAVTPFLLARLHAATGGRSLEANRALILANARLAARIAVALCGGC